MKMNLTYRAGARDPLGLKNQICRIIMLIWVQKFSHFSMVFRSSRPVGSCLACQKELGVKIFEKYLPTPVSPCCMAS